ncbi:MAG TPA: hypothetical protein VJS68_01355 [Thermoplasmata archaeon]|nr:hypothetical protein [Thermoplasmata archaeon]
MRLLIRTVATFINVGIFVAAVALQFLDPTISSYVFYAVLAWFIGSIFLFRLPFMNRPIGQAARLSAPASASPASSPLPSGAAPLSPGAASPASPAAPALDFCPYCTATIQPGTVRCPQCGRTVPTW